MSDIFITSRPVGLTRECGRNRGSAGRAAADWLRLAAAPTFATMALFTAFDGGQQDMLCAAMQHASPLGGMAPMYVLMSAFHSAPWLKLVQRRRRGPPRSSAMDSKMDLYRWRRPNLFHR